MWNFIVMLKFSMFKLNYSLDVWIWSKKLYVHFLYDPKFVKTNNWT